jgi:hypothetical protein
MRSEDIGLTLSLRHEQNTSGVVEAQGEASVLAGQAVRQSVSLPPMSQIPMNIPEPETVAQPIPPEMNAADCGKNRINPMHETGRHSR